MWNAAVKQVAFTCERGGAFPSAVMSQRKVLALSSVDALRAAPLVVRDVVIGFATIK
jgi:ABC-type molybdate transport system permease subunit